MGLTNSSVGKNADVQCVITKNSPDERVIAIAGNPNVGKSTLFNNLTGMNQHTGNWPGKTVTNAVGRCKSSKNDYVLVDIPGTYSLMAHSAEEEVARNFICFSKPDAIAVVCDATCLERNLNLVLQALEISGNVIVCVNLLDEARRKHISVDLEKLSELLGVPVVGIVARKKKSLSKFVDSLDKISAVKKPPCCVVQYPDAVERALSVLVPAVHEYVGDALDPRWLSLRLLDPDPSLIKDLYDFLGYDIMSVPQIISAHNTAIELLSENGIDPKTLTDVIVKAIVTKAEQITGEVISVKGKYNHFDLKADKLLTGKMFGYPLMLVLLLFVFWLTISGANYPSAALTELSFRLRTVISDGLMAVKCPLWLHDMLVLGVYNTLSWVVSVMLPPMAIFFPLFTLLEDLGYLPRIAYNLDKPFKHCNACGKQALTMCMGFGCNAAGVVGCRIIDSPRERLIAILTNSFVPCNGRFPSLITLITMFFVFSGGIGGSIASAVILTLVIILGIIMTLAASKFLSVTFLKGEPSSFTLELPPYRKPQIGKVIVRSVFDRTLFVLGRSAAVAAPAGLVIWLMANITFGDTSLLSACAGFLDPLGRLVGMDGVILMAFILGFPANEIVIPIMIMAYMSAGSISDIQDITVIKQIFIDNGWTVTTAVCVMLFSMFHWPCSTTMLTVKKETGSIKWTLLSFILPTVIGFLFCFIVASISKLF